MHIPRLFALFLSSLEATLEDKYINSTELLNLWTNRRPHCFPSPDSFTVNHSNWLLVFQHGGARQRWWKQITREWKQKTASSSSSSLLGMHLRILDRYGRIHQCCISMLEIRLWLWNYCAGVWNAITFSAVNRLMVMVWLLITSVIRLLAVNQSGRQLEIFLALCTNTSSLMTKRNKDWLTSLQNAVALRGEESWTVPCISSQLGRLYTVSSIVFFFVVVAVAVVI